jgi:hypothetical protein
MNAYECLMPNAGDPSAVMLASLCAPGGRTGGRPHACASLGSRVVCMRATRAACHLPCDGLQGLDGVATLGTAPSGVEVVRRG